MDLQAPRGHNIKTAPSFAELGLNTSDVHDFPTVACFWLRNAQELDFTGFRKKWCDMLWKEVVQ